MKPEAQTKLPEPLERRYCDFS